MKFSEMPTDRAADVMCNVAIPMNNIATDAELLAFLRETSTERFQKQAFFVSIGETFVKFVPLVFKTHRDDLYAIIMEMTGKKLDEVKKQTLKQTMDDIRGFFDRDFLDFFTSFKA